MRNVVGFTNPSRDRTVARGQRRQDRHRYSSGNFAVLRFNTDGTADTTFDSDGKVTTDIGDLDQANALLIGPDYKITLVGQKNKSMTFIGDFAPARYKVSSSLEQRLYATTDANHNVTSIDDVFGAVKERFVYDPYRNSTVLTSAFASTSDGYSRTVRSQGQREDATSNTIDSRNRIYGLGTGRWMQADNIGGYVDGANRYQFVKSNPLRFVDSHGTDAAYNGGYVINKSSHDIWIEGDWKEFIDTKGVTRFPSTQAEEKWLVEDVGIPFGPSATAGNDPWRVEVLSPGTDSRQFRKGVTKLDPKHLILDVDFVLQQQDGGVEMFLGWGALVGKPGARVARLDENTGDYIKDRYGFTYGQKIGDGEEAIVKDCPNLPNKVYLE